MWGQNFGKMKDSIDGISDVDEFVDAKHDWYELVGNVSVRKQCEKGKGGLLGFQSLQRTCIGKL